MILRSLRVQGWRCFAAAVEVGPLASGLNIIHGPNGSGKSTLMMALVRGLFDSHTVQGTHMKSLQPWGRSLSPQVTIEFEHEGQQYQLHKQFLSAASSQLQRFEAGRFVPLAESRAADEQARALLGGESPARGASDQRHWGWAQILWATQGNLRIEQLADGTRATIQEALGQQLAGPSHEGLERQIAQAYEQYFTGTGKLKSGAAAPKIIELQMRLTKAEEHRQSLQSRLEDFDHASRKIEDLKNLSHSARHREVDLTERLRTLRQQAQTFLELRHQKKLLEQEVAAAEDSYRHLNERITNLQTAREELARLNLELQRQRADVPTQAKLVEQARVSDTEAEREVQRIRAQRKEVTAARQLAKVAERYARSRDTLGELDKRLNDIDGAQLEVQRLRESREQLVAPDKKTLAKIIQVARVRDDARLRLDAAFITVTIQPETDLLVSITTAEEPGQRTLTAGQAYPIQGAPEVVFHVPGIGELRATGPTGSVDDLRQQWEAAGLELAELTAGFGTRDIAALEKLRAQADEWDKQLAQADVKIKTLLGKQAVDDLRHQRSVAANAIAEILADHEAWRQTPPDPEAIARQAEAIESQFTSEIDRAESARDRAGEALRSAQQSEHKHATNITGLETQVAAVEKRFESLAADGRDEPTRLAERTRLAMQRDTAQGKLAQINQQITDLGGDPEKSVAMLEKQLDGLRHEAMDAERRLSAESARLEQIIAEAPYSALATVEDEIFQLQDEVRRQQLHLDATRLLYETFHQQKRDVLQAIVDPIRLRANHILQRIVGTRFENVHFDDSLLPQGVAPRALDESIVLDQISGGEQEQVYFAVRMALADVGLGSQRQLVVLDDVFTYTDTSRLARIATILDEAAERFQIVLLTCHPERYRGLPAAKFFDLESLVQE